ncbi:hypothetical protein [Thermocatellispora tengchongensis]|uniref:hypothetical protein n=1 Tax=Thermocatellispora tengchongensis TaxID=1073253 RepID=UPI003630B74C
MLTTAGTDVTALVRQMLGDPRAEIAERREEPIGHPLALSTAGLHRVSGTTTEGRPWSFVVKAIRSAKHFPMIGTLPASFREMLLADFPGAATPTCTCPIRRCRAGCACPGCTGWTTWATSGW